MNKLTVICAVWHNDKDREILLKGHMKTLDDQLTPVNRIYVFDGNDKPPEWLRGEIIISRSNLTIYEAWNVGLSLVSTPYVMNLNLDDRLQKNASELYISELDSGSDLVGGEWEVCYSQDETDSRIYSEHLEFHQDWPPKNGVKTKLGSGSGERGTYGPSCAWKMQLHASLPRFPYRFSNGETRKAGSHATTMEGYG
jgi:hypothetical protein